ncbi:hypothetical protein PNOK_0688300 [Pyrrhoderma noxium]|uniref:Uncharacterized protein n=1 Tax=Pyrrhoderma noxium TaxID=2282107 RepID=A0A286UB89_9AGAM|nr:hypothetical protein PNOK_0688300 [Pyrrhoderma noxium]
MFLSTFTYVLASTLALLSHTQALPTSSPSPRYFPQGTISSPANGTIILPGQSFDFYYNQRGDYCLSSYNFSVWLLTSPPGSSMIGDDSTMTGHYFGRFSYSSITNENPANPAPAQLTMPDFSKSSGGFGIGASGSSVPMYLAVLEEWDECAPTLGQHFSLAVNTLIYNGTSTTTPSS